MEGIGEKVRKLEEELEKLRGLLNIEGKKKRLEQLQLKMSEAAFWQEQKTSVKVVGEMKSLKSDVEDWQAMRDKIKELEELFSLSDVSLNSEILKELNALGDDVEKLRLRTFFSGKFDEANAIVEINSGAGGTEACDWAHMLFRMYFRWAEEKKFKYTVLNEVKGEEAGIKNITFLIEGLRAYGLLKAERGVHRLVRISPFDANRRRHTSFASIDILPEVTEGIDISLKSEELRIDTFRASGRGGQHVNVTDSAIRITHLPTGIVTSCQNERSQYQNKQVALKVLKAKLHQLKEEEKKKELDKISGNKRKIEWGSQIRSYVLHPYLMVKDHRTNLAIGDAWAVLDGKIDELIYAYLKTQISASI